MSVKEIIDGAIEAYNIRSDGDTYYILLGVVQASLEELAHEVSAQQSVQRTGLVCSGKYKRHLYNYKNVCGRCGTPHR